MPMISFCPTCLPPSGCETKPPGKCVLYSGVYLPYTGITAGQNLDDILVTINNALQAGSGGISVVEHADTSTITLSGDGTIGNPLSADFIGTIPADTNIYNTSGTITGVQRLVTGEYGSGLTFSWKDQFGTPDQFLIGVNSGGGGGRVRMVGPTGSLIISHQDLRLGSAGTSTTQAYLGINMTDFNFVFGADPAIVNIKQDGLYLPTTLSATSLATDSTGKIVAGAGFIKNQFTAAQTADWFINGRTSQVVTTDVTSLTIADLSRTTTNSDQHSILASRNTLRIECTDPAHAQVNGPEAASLIGSIIVTGNNTQNLTHADLGMNGVQGTAGVLTGATGNIRLIAAYSAQVGVTSTTCTVTDVYWYKVQKTNFNSNGTNWANAIAFGTPDLSSLGTANTTHFLIGTPVTGNWNCYYGTSLNNYLGTGNTLINTTVNNGAKLQVSGLTTISSTAEALRLVYDTSNYLSFSATNSTGSFSITATGSSPNRSITITPATLFPAGITTGTEATNLYIGSVTAPFLTSNSKYLFSGASSIQGSVSMTNGGVNLLSVNNSYANLILGNIDVTTPSSGTNSTISSLVVKPPNIISGGASVTNAASLYIDSSPSGVATNNYSLWVNSGLVCLGTGAILINRTTDDTSGSKLQVNGTITANGIRGGILSTDTLTLLNYSSSTTGAVLDQYGLTIGGGTASGNTLLKTTRIFADPVTNNVHGFRSQPSAYSTIADNTMAIFGGFFTPTITASNTKNWTNAIGMQGISVAPTINAGATGIITGIIGVTCAANFLATGSTVTYYTGIRSYIETSSVTTLTNSTLIQFDQESTPSGTWGLYQGGSRNNRLGTGITFINTSTDDATGAKLQVNGRISASPAISGSEVVVLSQLSSFGGGTVTSVGLTLPSIFSVSGSPVTSAGTLTGTLATQTANTIFGGPTSGGAATPTFRALVANDIPNIDAAKITTGTIATARLGSGIADATTYLAGDQTYKTIPSAAVTSVGLSAPSVFSVASSPITTSGTIALTFATGQTANQVLASPDSSTGAVGLRALVANDIPSLTTSKITSGTFGTAFLGSGTANTTVFLRGDGTWTNTLAGAFSTTGKITSTLTTEQLRTAYDASNYMNVVVSSTGSTTFDLTGTSPLFSFGKGTSFTSGIAANNTGFNLSVVSINGGTSVTTATYLFGGATTINYRVGIRGSGANTLAAASSGANFIVANNAITTASSGIHAVVANMVVTAPTITSGGASTVTVGASLYIDGPTTGAASNFSTYVAAGVSYFKGGLRFDQGSDATGDTFYRDSSGLLARLGIGSTGNVLTVAAGLPSWAAPVIPTIDQVTTSGNSTTNSVTFGGITNNANISNLSGSFRGHPRTASNGETLLISDYVVSGNTSGGNCILTLPTGGSFNGIIYYIDNSARTNTLTIQRSGSDTISSTTLGNTSLVIPNSAIIQLFGSVWTVYSLL